MSFAFGFNGGEYASDNDEDDDEQGLSSSTQFLSLEPSVPAAAPVDHYTLTQLIKSLPLSLAYTTLDILDDVVSIPRRELWDIKHHVMSGFTSSVEEEKVMEFMGSDDVIRGVYEGGFKTWECSIDLARHLANPTTSSNGLSSDGREGLVVVELGCGTGLPTLVILLRALKAGRKVRLIVQDYNLAVLQLSTIPNLYLLWASLLIPRNHQHENNCHDVEWAREGEVDVTCASQDAFLAALESSGITIEGLSGSWSPLMAQQIGRVDLILASETIYATQNLDAFVTLLQQTLKRDSGEALVAAKCVYFGVGGGVEEFTRKLKMANMTAQPVFHSRDGVRRTILSIKHSSMNIE